MVNIKRTILGVSDVKNLCQSIKVKYTIDLFNYALSSLKRRVEVFMYKNFITSIDELIHRIENDNKYFEIFINSIQVDSTEMFRDPEFWDELKNLVLKKYRHATELKIWLPDTNSGEEFYSLQIILQQLDLFDKANVLITTVSGKNIEKIKKAVFDNKKMEINTANFQRFEEGGSLNGYFLKNPKYYTLKPQLLENLSIEQHDIVCSDVTGVYDIVLFRNKMLYYNTQLKNDVLKKLTGIVRPGGYLIVGVKESVDYPGWEKDFQIFSESEKIYKKILF